jgi:hypothetical protein
MEVIYIMPAPLGNKNAVGNNGGRPLKFQSVDELEEKINAYFESCWRDIIVRDKNGFVILDEDGQPVKDRQQVEPYTLTGLAVFLDCDSGLLSDYNDREDSNGVEFLPTLKRARDKIKAYAEQSLWKVKNPAGIIFNLKANWGMQDTQKIDVNLTTLAATLKDLSD